jgi:hypothetical protein
LRAAGSAIRLGGEVCEAAQSPDEDVVDVVGGVEFAHPDGLPQQGAGVVAGPDTTWTVQHHLHTRPWTLHHPVLAMDWIEKVVRTLHQQDTETNR